jgi:hypothetical protein
MWNWIFYEDFGCVQPKESLKHGPEATGYNNART